ncbi:hypothetical protein V2J09_003219 [Rumex salicifolius]
MLENEPGLNPNQPNQRRKVPRTTRAALWALMGTGLPLASKRPTRGPSMREPQRPATPPTRWTTPLPAKSMAPEPKRGSDEAGLRRPAGDQTQWATTGYTKPEMNDEKTR